MHGYRHAVTENILPHIFSPGVSTSQWSGFNVALLETFKFTKNHEWKLIIKYMEIVF